MAEIQIPRVKRAVTVDPVYLGKAQDRRTPAMIQQEKRQIATFLLGCLQRGVMNFANVYRGTAVAPDYEAVRREGHEACGAKYILGCNPDVAMGANPEKAMELINRYLREADALGK